MNHSLAGPWRHHPILLRTHMCASEVMKWQFGCGRVKAKLMSDEGFEFKTLWADHIPPSTTGLLCFLAVTIRCHFPFYLGCKLCCLSLSGDRSQVLQSIWSMLYILKATSHRFFKQIFRKRVIAGDRLFTSTFKSQKVVLKFSECQLGSLSGKEPAVSCRWTG